MTGGVLMWSVKRSLIEYVSALDDGSVHWATAGPGRFAMAAATVRPPGTTGAFHFEGGVRLSGHLGLMEVVLADPVVDLDAAVLRATVPGEREPVALLALGPVVVAVADDGWRYTAAAPTLLRDGVAVFDGNYRPGAVFDPIAVHVPKEASA